MVSTLNYVMTIRVRQLSVARLLTSKIRYTIYTLKAHTCSLTITRTHYQNIWMISTLLSNKTVFSASNIRGTSNKEREAWYKQYKTLERGKFHNKCITTYRNPIIDIYSFHNRCIIISVYSITGIGVPDSIWRTFWIYACNFLQKHLYGFSFVF